MRSSVLRRALSSGSNLRASTQTIACRGRGVRADELRRAGHRGHRLNAVFGRLEIVDPIDDRKKKGSKGLGAHATRPRRRTPATTSAKSARN